MKRILLCKLRTDRERWRERENRERGIEESEGSQQAHSFFKLEMIDRVAADYEHFFSHRHIQNVASLCAETNPVQTGQHYSHQASD